LPSAYKHGAIPDTPQIIAKSGNDRLDQTTIDRPDVALNNPSLDVKFGCNSSHHSWAADVWYSIYDRIGVREVQRLLSAKQSGNDDK
jgi:hypothetical protein